MALGTSERCYNKSIIYLDLCFAVCGEKVLLCELKLSVVILGLHIYWLFELTAPRDAACYRVVLFGCGF